LHISNSEGRIMKNVEMISNMMTHRTTREEVILRLKSLENVDKDDFYTNGELDLNKAKELGKLHQISGFSCDESGNVVSIKLYNDYSGYVYLFEAENGFIKIGQTENVEKRFSAISVDSPGKVSIRYFRFVKNRLEVEKKLHRVFRENRKKGEWFMLTEEQTQMAIHLLEAESGNGT